MKIACLIAWMADHGTPIPCAICGSPILPGQKVAFDHRHAKTRGGDNAVLNLAPVHDEKSAPLNCHDIKTFGGAAKATTRGSDIAEGAKTDRMRAAHAEHLAVRDGQIERFPSRIRGRGFENNSRPMPGSRASGIRKRMNRRVERWQ
jgi:hypothetical protein